MTGWISIVGIGEDGLDGLSAAARTLVESAEVLAGGARHLGMIPDDHPAERLTWHSPFHGSLQDLRAREGRRVTVLATGDPMHYGVGATLAREMPEAIAAIVPSPSAFSLAAARMRWPLQDVTCLSVHGLPAESLYLHVYPGARLLILSEDGDTPAGVAALLTSHGFGASRLSVLEQMGGARESRREALAREWGDGPVADLNTIAVECAASPEAPVYSRVQGLPDAAFEHDGQMTKREVRAATLAALAPLPGQLLWDVGAGCGSVAIEWMRAGGRATGIESDAARAAMAARNAAALGVSGLEIVIGAAPGALDGLATPDTVFIGGGIGTAGVFEACWEALGSGGNLVANTVTIEGESSLAKYHREHGGQLVRLAVSRLSAVGSLHGWKSLMPVTQWQVTKS